MAPRELYLFRYPRTREDWARIAARPTAQASAGEIAWRSDTTRRYSQWYPPARLAVGVADTVEVRRSTKIQADTDSVLPVPSACKADPAFDKAFVVGECRRWRKDPERQHIAIGPYLEVAGFH
jgi:hypothetical protein